MKKKIGKGVLIACIVLGVSVVPIASCSFRSAKTGEEITFREKAQEVGEAVANVPDEKKADVLDAVSVLLTLLGLGGAGTAVKLGSNYFRNRKKPSAGGSETAVSEKTPDGGA